MNQSAGERRDARRAPPVQEQGSAQAHPAIDAAQLIGAIRPADIDPETGGHADRVCQRDQPESRKQQRHKREKRPYQHAD